MPTGRRAFALSWRGFRDEYVKMFHCVRRFATPQMRLKYKELTGGDLDEDFIARYRITYS